MVTNQEEIYAIQLAGISTAATGYWKEGDLIHPDYDTVALRDVAKLYAKYDQLYQMIKLPDNQQVDLIVQLKDEVAKLTAALDDLRQHCHPIQQGWKLVAVNERFDDLMFWLDRCSSKGHLDNCSDLVEPWENFEYELIEQPTPLISTETIKSSIP